MPPSSTAVDRLRAATAAAHRALDGTLDPVARLRTPSGRVAVLRGYHRLHATAEAAMAPHLATEPALDFDARRRTPAILADLAALGVDPPASPPAILPVASRPAALGTLYVMEGSTLGGRLILRRLQPDPQQCGLSFLDPYGAHTGRMWRRVLALLEGDLAHDEPALTLAIAAAVAAFSFAGSCLAPAILRQAA